MPPTHTTEGLVAAGEIRAEYPDVAVLLLSHHVEPRYAAQLLEGRVDRVGYLLKQRVFHPAILVDALDRLVAGEIVLDPTIVTRLMQRRRERDPLEALSGRESERCWRWSERAFRTAASLTGSACRNERSRRT